MKNYVNGAISTFETPKERLIRALITQKNIEVRNNMMFGANGATVATPSPELIAALGDDVQMADILPMENNPLAKNWQPPSVEDLAKKDVMKDIWMWVLILVIIAVIVFFVVKFA